MKRSRRTIRLPSYDYATPAYYFVTVCAYQRQSLFEEPAIRAGIEEAWRALPEHFQHVAIDAFVVMTNHVHGIIVITESDAVGAQHAAPLPRTSVRPGSLGAVVRSFKSAGTKRCHELGGKTSQPLWQRNYYERIIRNDAELGRAQEYIQNNPLQWQFDAENRERTADVGYWKTWGWLENTR